MQTAIHHVTRRRYTGLEDYIAGRVGAWRYAFAYAVLCISEDTHVDMHSRMRTNAYTNTPRARHIAFAYAV